MSTRIDKIFQTRNRGTVMFSSKHSPGNSPGAELKFYDIRNELPFS